MRKINKIAMFIINALLFAITLAVYNTHGIHFTCFNISLWAFVGIIWAMGYGLLFFVIYNEID